MSADDLVKILAAAAAALAAILPAVGALWAKVARHEHNTDAVAALLARHLVDHAREQPDRESEPSALVQHLAPPAAPE